MASMRLLLVALAGCALAAQATQVAQNPVRKVVTLLQDLQKKVQAEGVREKELYDKFMCYCSTGKGDLEKSIADAEAKIGTLGADLEAAKANLEQAQADNKQAHADRDAAKQAVAEATALREKEAAAFAKADADYTTNIAAIAKAVAALEKGAAGSFLQTAAAQSLRRLAMGSMSMADADRQALVAFLSQGAGDSYAPQSGQVTGILKQMGDEFAATLADLKATEAAAIQNFEELVAAKSKEIEVLIATIESKQSGELGVFIAQTEADIGDTTDALADDKKYLAELATSCSTKTAEWEERSKNRAEELVALADTIKVLNDDDALELFKKTLPSAGAGSLLQVQVRADAVRRRALDEVRAAARAAAKRDRPALDLLLVALTSGKAMSQGQFDQVLKLIDDLVATLKKEQEEDDAKLEYCKAQFDSSDDKKKALEQTIADEATAIAAAEEGIQTKAEQIAALTAGIKALDKAVAEATEQRAAENAEYKDLIASNTAAKELLLFAKNRLNKFYNPKLYKAPPKRELSAETRIFENLGGYVPTVPPGGIAETGIAVLAEVGAHSQQLSKDAPPPPPETWGAYQKKSEDGNGVIAMIDILVADLEKEISQAEVEEKEAQKEYEALTADAADKRAADLKSLNENSAIKAELEGALEAHTDAKKAAETEHLATLEYIHSLHGECDWLVKYFDARKEARAGEVDSLGKAKAVLSGADYALLLQTARTHAFLSRAARA